MGEQELIDLSRREGLAAWRLALARGVESRAVQHFIVVLILFNAVIL